MLVFNCSILGIQSAQLIRITARADGSGCDVYYKDEASRSGWFPRPSQSSVYTPIWKTMFKHPTDELQGHSCFSDLDSNRGTRTSAIVAILGDVLWYALLKFDSQIDLLI